MSQLHKADPESSTTHGNDTQLLPTQVFQDWLAKKGARSDSASASNHVYIKSPLVSPISSSTEPRSDDDNANLVSSDDDTGDRSAHVAEEITSPATFLSPNTPCLEGQPQDFNTSTARRSKRSLSRTRSNWLGPKAIGTVTGLSQIFHQTQAPTSPVQNALLDGVSPNKRRKLSTSPPSSPFATVGNHPSQTLRSASQAKTSASYRQQISPSSGTKLGMTATKSVHEKDTNDVSAFPQNLLVASASQTLNMASLTQTINVADSQQECVKSASIPNKNLPEPTILPGHTLSDSQFFEPSKPVASNRHYRSEGTSSIPAPRMTSSPHEGGTFGFDISSPPSATLLEPSPGIPETIRSNTRATLRDSIAPLPLMSTRSSRSSSKAQTHGSNGENNSNYNEPRLGRDKQSKRQSEPLGAPIEPLHHFESQCKDPRLLNAGTATIEKLDIAPYGKQSASPQPDTDCKSHHENFNLATAQLKKNQRLRAVNAKAIRGGKIGEPTAEDDSREPISVRLTSVGKRLHTKSEIVHDVAAVDPSRHLGLAHDPLRPAGFQAGDRSYLSPQQPGPLAPHRVFALFGGKDRAAYYPGSVIAERTDDPGLLHVAFDDGNAAEVKRHLIFSLNLKIGDLVKVDKPHCRTFKFIVSGFEDLSDAMSTNSASMSQQSDIHGYQTIILERKLPRESKDPTSSAIHERSPISNLYISNDLLKRYVNRAWSSITPLSNAHSLTCAISRSNTAQLPSQMTSSRNRRHTAGFAPTGQLKSSAVSTGRPDGLFANMVFGVTYMSENSAEKSRISDLIRANGGYILAGGFDELFEAPEAPRSPSASTQDPRNRPTNELQLLPWAAGFKFSALITDHYSRKAKYMQALALNLPCLSGNWIAECIQQKQIVPWDRYLLPAGESVALSGAVRSRTGLKSNETSTAALASMIDHRPKLLQGQDVLMIMGKGKLEHRRQAHLFLTQALAPGRVFRVPDLESAQQILRNGRLVIQWVYVYDDCVSKAKSVLNRHNVVGDEFVMQSLILGTLLERH